VRSRLEFASPVGPDTASGTAQAPKLEHSTNIKRKRVSKERLIVSGRLRWQHYQVIRKDWVEDWKEQVARLPEGHAVCLYRQALQHGRVNGHIEPSGVDMFVTAERLSGQPA
jgi:hypothetical protein